MIDEIYNFIDGYISREHIAKYIEYGTLLHLRKKGKLVGVVMFNIKGKKAHIIYLHLSPEINSYKAMSYFIREGKRRFPNTPYIEFEREIIGDTKKRLLKI